MKYKNINYKLIKLLNEIQYHFDGWIDGNFEDDPLPYEINVIMYCFSIKNNMISLNMSAGEHMPKINVPLLYCPLELQFFYYKPFFDLLSQPFFYKTKRYRFSSINKVRVVENVITRLVKNYLCSNKKSVLNSKIICVGEMYKNTQIQINMQNKEIR